ncbi:NAD(P)H-dependent oxidoreductase [Comamonas jiangduensis]|uniref:NAD(P)H-dependent oxidoreductase n=1 Tax=Comamonas jiangduensis TaxID=1194168 RepID=UPI003BF7BA36
MELKFQQQLELPSFFLMALSSFDHRCDWHRCCAAHISSPLQQQSLPIRNLTGTPSYCRSSSAIVRSPRTVHIDLVDLVQDIGVHLWRDKLPATALHALQTIEGADFLILGSPVFRGSMPGLFKHLFDLIDSPAMLGKPVLLAATGGSQRHALVIEHQIRPLLAFFQTLTLPVGVYASEEDFQDGKLQSKAVTERIQPKQKVLKSWWQRSIAKISTGKMLSGLLMRSLEAPIVLMHGCSLCWAYGLTNLTQHPIHGLMRLCRYRSVLGLRHPFSTMEM